MSPHTTAAALVELHERTDRRFADATQNLAIRCGEGCHSCCADELTVWVPEAQRIADHVRSAAVTITRHPPGKCAFLTLQGACQVYAARPYVCRSQGAVLRYNDGDGEQRATCAEHLGHVDLNTLSIAATFAIGPAEAELLSIATAELGGRGGRGLPERVGLRELATKLSER